MTEKNYAPRPEKSRENFSIDGLLAQQARIENELSNFVKQPL
jgi:hypothetical protein